MLYGKCKEWSEKNKDKIDRFIKDNPEVTDFGRMKIEEVRDADLCWSKEDGKWMIKSIKVVGAEGKECWSFSPRFLSWLKRKYSRVKEDVAVAAAVAEPENLLERLKSKLNLPSVNGK